MISTSAREQLDQISEGLTSEQYIDAIWFRRNQAYEKTHSSRAWPFERLPDHIVVPFEKR